MKMQIFKIDVPIRPFIVEPNVEVVRLSDVKAEVARIEAQALKWKENAEKKVERYSKNDRFRAAYNYWLGTRNCADGLHFSVKRFFE